MRKKFNALFTWFEKLIDPFQDRPVVQPPTDLLAFYWHFARQIWPLFALLLFIGLVVALIEVSLFAFLGEIIDMVRQATDSATFFADHGTTLIFMAFIAMILRPAVALIHGLLVQQSIVPCFTNMIRWQTHRYVLRQSMGFYQNDFAGRIATKIIQTGPSLRETIVQAMDGVWFMTIYTGSALILFAQADLMLTLPIIVWLVCYVGTLAYFVPRIKERSRITSEANSLLTGRIVDSYTNIMTVKLFAHTDREDHYAEEGIREHTRMFHDLMRPISAMKIMLFAINGLLIVSAAGLALWLWSLDKVTEGGIALVIGLVLRLNNMSGWIMWTITNIFEAIGRVQDGIRTISQPHTVTDRPGATELEVPRGEIRYEHIRFHYGKTAGVIEDLSLTIRPGEKVGLVGRSGAGKSTLVNLLLRFHDLEGGRILIDGQDIADVSQESLRTKIGMVTQDTSLLHRSVLANLIYGRPDVSEEEAIEAAEQAQAAAFIPGLVDLRGREGYHAHVGERGVKLSGGQRQRVAIARVLLKDAPILVLDEATSALDSEAEAAIQEQFTNLMAGKTVIAIAHRLSTIAAMDRLVIMDEGQIIEEGSHRKLIAKGGVYARLWARQSGGFLAREDMSPPDLQVEDRGSEADEPETIRQSGLVDQAGEDR
ncbi:MAG: ABC transporter ATP-binding protein [Geminicoccales bacterium]